MATPQQKKRQVKIAIDEVVNSMNKDELIVLMRSLDKATLAAAMKKALEITLLEKGK